MDLNLAFDFTLHSAGVQESRCLFSIDIGDPYGSSIAVAIRSLDHSLFVRLILKDKKAGARCAPYD